MTNETKTTAGRTHASRRTSSPTLAAGIDVGYATLKVMTNQGERWLIPTAVAPVDLDDTLLGWRQPENGSTPQGERTFPTTVTLADGTRYIIGASAIWSGRRLRDHLHWDQWWQSPVYQALLTALPAILPPRAVIVTGLPLHLAMVESARAAVKQLFRRRLRAHTVSLVPQGIAAAFTMDALSSPDPIAIIDVGGRTTEFVTIVQGKIQMARCTGIRAGVMSCYEAVATHYRERGAWELDAYVVEQAVRGECPPHRIATGVTHAALREQIRAAAKPLAAHILGKCRELWGDGQRLDRVLLCGGGADLLAGAIAEWRQDVQLAPDAIWLNAQGYLKAAQEIVASIAGGSGPSAAADVTSESDSADTTVTVE